MRWEICNEGDRNGNENVKTAIGFLSKTTSLHVHHAFYLGVAQIE